MANYKVTDAELISIADAIRTKGGTSASLAFPSGFISAISAISEGGGSSHVFGSKTISQNGEYDPASDSLDAFSHVTVSVPNTYSAADEGKVVASGALSAQGIMSVSQNSVYDTTLISQVSVDVQGSGGDNYYDVVMGVESGSIHDSSISIIPTYKFYNNSCLTEILAENVSMIGSFAFYNCSLSNAVFPECETIVSSAFANTQLETISFPKCKQLHYGVFMYCQKLKEVDLPLCSFISNDVFSGCSSISNISLPSVSSIGENAFRGCFMLTDIYLPECKSISSSAFYDCLSASMVSLPKCEKIGTEAFYNCKSVHTVRLNKCTNIGYQAFRNCQNLESFYILASSVPYLGNYAFNNTPITTSSILGYFGSIYVLESMVDTFKSTGNWVALSDRITAYVEE